VVPVALVGVAFIVIGAGTLAWPRQYWYLTRGLWSYDNPEDVRLSGAYLFWNKVQAVWSIFIGFVILVCIWAQATQRP